MHEYWNQKYVDYWKEKCELAEKNPLDAALPPSLVVVESVFQSLEANSGDRLLDVGCGFGRMIPLYLEAGLKPTGVDISDEMIEEAKRSYPSVALQVCRAEELPFTENAFDLIVCWGAFDTIPSQFQALTEFRRVLRPKGRILITGKNRHYRDDDPEAKLAEEGAKRKNHPNAFTVYDDLLAMADKLGLRRRLELFFNYRGDMSKGACSIVRPPAFYEYAMILSL